jgi:hypothetical protein
VAEVERSGKDLQTTVKEGTERSAITLVEGVALRGGITSQSGEIIYKIPVNQLEGYEKPITI